MRLGGARYRDAIDDLEKESMDPEFEEHYQDLLRQWEKDKERIIRSAFREMKLKLSALSASKEMEGQCKLIYS